MKNILICLLLLALTACGQATALEYGADVNRGPCASGFTRTAPGVCTNDEFISFGLNTTCTTIDAGVPSNAKSITVGFIHQVVSTNSVGERASEVFLYRTDDSTCSGTAVNASVVHIFEQVATTAGTSLLSVGGTGQYSYPIFGGLTSIKATRLGTASIYLYGYTD